MPKFWTPERPINELPEEISDIFQERAKFLYKELKNHHLDVVLIPAPDPHFEGHCIRAVEDCNPPWYRELFHGYPNWRRDRTERALGRIQDLKDLPFQDGPIGCVRSKYHYDSELRRLIYDMLIAGDYYIENGRLILRKFPNDEVRKSFGLNAVMDEEVLRDFWEISVGYDPEEEFGDIPF